MKYDGIQTFTFTVPLSDMLADGGASAEDTRHVNNDYFREDRRCKEWF